MKKKLQLLLLLCCLAILCPASAKTEASAYKTGYINCDKPIKMYKRANVKSKVVRQLCHGKQVKFKYYKKGWYYVIRKGKAGFIRAKYLSKIYLVKQSTPIYYPGYFMQMGVLYWGGWRWTWYSQRVLPGGGLSIPGRHVDERGYVCDANGYICLASSSLSYRTIVSTPFGKPGRVYDSGCAYDTLDVYVNW